MIIVSSNINRKEQINSMLSKANMLLGMLKRSFESRDTDLWKKLYTSMIRPHLEYTVQIWNPRLIGDIERLEKVK